jgi:hypothetical protein
MLLRELCVWCDVPSITCLAGLSSEDTRLKEPPLRAIFVARRSVLLELSAKCSNKKPPPSERQLLIVFLDWWPFAKSNLYLGFLSCVARCVACVSRCWLSIAASPWAWRVFKAASKVLLLLRSRVELPGLLSFLLSLICRP